MVCMGAQLGFVPSSSPAVTSRSPLFSQLPVELLDLIASFVATHRDIISLALTCSTLTHILIPAHAAYRTIRIQTRRGPVPLATIAGRPDRAAGVRCFVLFDQSEKGRFLPERVPSTATSCVRPGPRGRGWNAETLEAATDAVRAMPNLHTLVFSMSSWRCGAAEMKFWAAVAGTCDSLRHLEYAQPPRDMAVPLPRSTAEMQMFPLWSISNLTSLSVNHAAFLRHPPSVVQFSRVLRNSPALESLTLAVYDPTFDLHSLVHDVRFPHLQSLALDILSLEEPSNAHALAGLLERTPTLQHVAWRHLEPDSALSANALPALRTLWVEVDGSPGTAGRALLRSGSAGLHALGSLCVDAATLNALAHMRGEALCRLEVSSFESIAVLVRAVRLFPRLRWLRLPAVDYWHEHLPVTPAPVHLGEWVEVLAALPGLEVFRGVSIFRDPKSTTIEENDERAHDILSLCPRMRQVEHWDLDPALVIALERESDRVVWRVEEVSRAHGDSTWETWETHFEATCSC